MPNEGKSQTDEKSAFERYYKVDDNGVMRVDYGKLNSDDDFRHYINSFPSIASLNSED